jgi:hypothetical protein
LGIAAIKQLAGNHRSFNGLPNTNVIGDEHSHEIELERHDERHKLIRAWPNRESSKAAKGSCAVAETQPGSIPQELSSYEISRLFGLGWCELGVFESVPFDFTVDATDFGFTAAKRT